MDFRTTFIRHRVSWLRSAIAALLVLTVSLLNTTPALAVGGTTGNVTGVVVDAVTGQPVANATVSLASPSQHATATTNARGAFNFTGLAVDTYTLSITGAGFDTAVVNGITIEGDQTVNLGNERLAKRLATIGRTRARSQSSVFQPTQTIDEVTVSGNRVLDATGKAASTSEAQLALSIPGVAQSKTVGDAGLGSQLTIRGGLSNEVGYQFDGVPLTEPFNNTDAANGTFNGLSTLQLISGAGDPSQGNVGSGVLNFTIKRGTFPATGLLDLEVGSPFFNHQLGFEYGFATPNGRFSDYVSFIGRRFAPDNYPYGANVQELGVYNGDAHASQYSFTNSEDFINNFVYRFGKNNDQSLQVLYRRRDEQRYGDLAYYKGRTSNIYDPNVQGLYQANAPSYYANGDFVSNVVSQLPLPDNYPLANTPASGPEIVQTVPLHVLKFEYDKNFSSSTFLALRAYNQYSANILPGNGSGYLNYINNYPLFVNTGGYTSGGIVELTHTFGDKHTVTLGGSLESRHPFWNQDDTYEVWNILQGSGFPQGGPNSSAVGGGAMQGPTLYDFLPKVNGACPVVAADAGAPGVSNACWLANHGVNAKVPGLGFGYYRTDYQYLAGYLRDQWSPSSKVKLDLGLRFDQANYKLDGDARNGASLSDPIDVSPAFLSAQVVHPHLVEPRLAANYLFDPGDSLRFGYGRSLNFADAQTFGTPLALSGINQGLYKVPVLPGTNIAGQPQTYTCGSGYNPLHAATSTAANVNPSTGGSYFQCANYGQQLFWATDQYYDAPDAGNNSPPTYANYDLTYQHQFRNGIGVRVTPFAKRGYNLPSLFVLKDLFLPDGTYNGSVFSTSNIAINRSNGIEFGASLPDRRVGFTGYLTATYTNVFNSTPPLINGEDQLPLVTKSSIALNNVYRAGFVSPFTANVGLSYRMHNGLRINPVFAYDRGYPTGTGLLGPSGGSQADGFRVNGNYAIVYQTNFDTATQPSIRPTYSGFGGLTSTGYGYSATQFVDPVNPGSYFHPNIAATRGTPESNAAGGVLTRPRLYTNLNVEFKLNRSTFGVGLTNLFDNQFSEPFINPLYQQVATGVSGPNTGQSQRGNPNSVYYPYGYRNIPAQLNGSSAYVTLQNSPRYFTFYYQLSL